MVVYFAFKLFLVVCLVRTSEDILLTADISDHQIVRPTNQRQRGRRRSVRGWVSSSLLPFVKSLVVHDLASTAPHDVPASVSSPPSHKPINPRILIQVLALFMPALQVGRSYKDPPHSLQNPNNRTFAHCWTLCESHELISSMVSLNDVVNSKPVLNHFNPHILIRLPTPTFSLFLPNNSQVLWRSTSPTKFLLSLSLSHHQ